MNHHSSMHVLLDKHKLDILYYLQGTGLGISHKDSAKSPLVEKIFNSSVGVSKGRDWGRYDTRRNVSYESLE